MTLVQTAVGDYRQEFLNLLTEELRGRGIAFELLAGRVYFDPTTTTKVSSSSLRLITNWFLAGRRLLLQPGALKLGSHPGVVVLELNPRIISNWWIAGVRSLTGRKTVMWGHAWPRSGPGARSDFVRNLMRSLASSVLVYSHTQVAELKHRMPRKPIFAAPNSLYKKENIVATALRAGSCDIIYVGRLVESKKPALLLRAFVQALPDLPATTRLLIVGDGPLREPMMQEAARLGVADAVEFFGHVADAERLRSLYERSVVSVSPGYVGLSITQSLAFGVPMVVSRNEPHAPEIEAAVEGFNTVFFETNSEASLAEALVSVIGTAKEWQVKREAIAADCAERYSVETMVAGFMNAVLN